MVKLLPEIDEVYIWRHRPRKALRRSRSLCSYMEA